MRFLKALSVIVISVLASGSLAQQTDIPTTGTFVLNHAQEQILGNSAGGAGGGKGLTALAQARITEGMDSKDETTPGTKKGSHAEFVISTHLDEQSSHTTITLTFQSSEPQLSPDIGLATELRLIDEILKISFELENWKATPSDQELETLNEGKVIPVDLSGVFGNLTYWTLVQNPAIGATLNRDVGARLEVETLSDAIPNPGLPFRAILTYDQAPAEAPKSILVEWEEGRAELPVFPSQDRTQFTTNWQYPTPVDTLYWDDTKRFPAQIPALDLVGTWAVEYSDPDGKNLTGTLIIDADGASMRLILNPGQDMVAFEAIEVMSTTNVATGNVGLEARFERPTDLAWQTPKNLGNPPEGAVLHMPYYTSVLTLSALGHEETFDVYLPEEQPVERIRIQLWDQEGNGQLSGPWYHEDNAGFLGDGGR